VKVLINDGISCLYASGRMGGPWFEAALGVADGGSAKTTDGLVVLCLCFVMGWG